MTTYFPLVVHGAMLIEPTETETKAELDRFADVLIALAERAKAGEKEFFKAAPSRRPPAVSMIRAPRGSRSCAGGRKG